MKSNVTLIGMPSAGKSTIGVLLAKRLGYSFIDADILIQEKEGRLLKEIIAQEGMDGFLQVENRVNASIEAKCSVIAPGGSVIYGKEAMEHLKETMLDTTISALHIYNESELEQLDSCLKTLMPLMEKFQLNECTE